MNWDEQQSRAVAETIEAIEAGQRRICFTAPTGWGKSRCMIRLIEWAAEQRKEASLYTNRRLLCSQTKGVLESHGIVPGMRAAGYKPALLRPVQLCMTQTEGAQVFTRKSRELHAAELVSSDEAHLQGGSVMERILQAADDRGATVVGFTATPLDLKFYDHLLIGATMREAFDCGAIVLSETYAPDEPDLKAIRKYQVGSDLSERDNYRAIMRPGIFGRVWEHWKRLNTNGEPTIVFGPDVKGSLFFAEAFHEKGVRAAHIDGGDVWLDGEWIGAENKDAREYVIGLVKSGEVPIVCNRFVLREGIDIPEATFGILATVFGSLSSYIQSCGRLLRSCDGKSRAVIQDHGGNWHRHGSINSERHWEIGDTNAAKVGVREMQMREKKQREPITCPQCFRTYMPTGKPCPSCGYVAAKHSRLVVQVDGSLRAVGGGIYRARGVSRKHDTADKWKRYYYGARNKGRTFNQAYAWFFQNEGYWPPKDLALMPTRDADWFAPVDSVPYEQLTGSKVAV